MTDAPATNELLALADHISATPSYTGKDLRTWRTPILERCDGDGDGNAVSVILVDAKQREVLVKALRAAATPSAEGAQPALAQLDSADAREIAGAARKCADDLANIVEASVRVAHRTGNSFVLDRNKTASMIAGYFTGLLPDASPGKPTAIVTCCITGAIPGDGGACGDCYPCLMGEASVPEPVKRLITEKNSLIQRVGELEDAVAASPGNGAEKVREALQIALGVMNGNLLTASRERNYAKAAEFEDYIKTLEAALHSTSAAGETQEPVWQANLREAWAALAMIRETVETLGPVGAMQASEHLSGPTFMHEAEAIVQGIQLMALGAGETTSSDGGEWRL